MPNDKPRHEPGRLLFTLVVVAFLVYAALFIYRTSFLVDGERYFSLFDDAMISMRYARNLASGHGLRWNAGGERIEGYTNPLWVGYMALIHLLPIARPKISLVVQSTAALLLAVNLYVVRRVALLVARGSESVALGAVVLTAAYLPINNWSLQGMEVSVLTLTMTLAVWFALRNAVDGGGSRAMWLALGISTWVRPDMVVPFLAVLLFQTAICPPHHRRHLMWGAVILAGCIGAQTAFREWYFGDVLPNTYYLKLTGFPIALRLARGLYVLCAFLWKSNPLLWCLPLVAVIGPQDSRSALLIWLVAVQMAYSVYVGGDAWEYWGGSNRYIAIVMPELFVLLSWGLWDICGRLTDAVRRRLPPATARHAMAWMFSFAIVFSVISFNCIHGPGALAEALLLRPPLHTGNGDENHLEVEEALALQSMTTSDATMAVVRAGTIPYFSDRPSIDLLGKNDRRVAHEKMRAFSSGAARLTEFRPGHMKFDYDYSIGQLQPDVVVQLWTHAEDARPYLDANYVATMLLGHCIYLRRDSTAVVWEHVEPVPCR